MNGTWYRPPIWLLIALLLINISVFFNAFKKWDDTANEKTPELPDWYPFKDRLIQRQENNELWEREQKRIKTLVIAGIIFIDIAVGIAFILGE